jgi:hypothetical protein
VAIPINVFVGEIRFELLDHDFEAGMVDRSEAGEKNPVRRFRTTWGVRVEPQQLRKINASPGCHGMDGLSIAKNEVVPTVDGLLQELHVSKWDLAIVRMRREEPRNVPKRHVGISDTPDLAWLHGMPNVFQRWWQ